MGSVRERGIKEDGREGSGDFFLFKKGRSRGELGRKKGISWER